MSQQDMDQPAVPRVAWDTDGEAWDEIIAGNGEPTALFKYRSDDGKGDELTLGQIDEQYGLDSLDSGERDRVEASRRDWAAIAMAHDMAAEFQAVGTLDDPWPEPPAVGAPCSCLTAEQAAVVTAGGFSLPLCAVHPEADR